MGFILIGILSAAASAASFLGWFTRTVSGVNTTTNASTFGADGTIYQTQSTGTSDVTLLKYNIDGSVAYYATGNSNLGNIGGGSIVETPNGYIFRHTGATGYSQVLHQFNAATGAGVKSYAQNVTGTVTNQKITYFGGRIAANFYDQIRIWTDADPAVRTAARGLSSFQGLNFRAQQGLPNNTLATGGRDNFSLPVLLCWNTSATLLWQRRITTSTDLGPLDWLDTGTDSSSNIYVLSNYRHGSYWLGKYSSAGVLQWTRRISPPSGQNFGAMYLATAADGSSYVASKFSTFYWWAKFDTSGTLVWQRQMSNDYTIIDIDVDPVNYDIIISGSSNSGFRYPASGEVLGLTISATGINGPIEASNATVVTGTLTDAAGTVSNFGLNPVDNTLATATFTTSVTTPSPELVQF